MNKVLEIIQSPSYDPKKIFTNDKERFTQVKTAFENINGSLPREKCILFLTEKITPTIFDKSINNTTRDQAIEIGFALLNYVNVTHLPHSEIDNFLTTIEEKYVAVIGELRDNNYPNWDKLWIFLIKVGHRKIIHKITLTNKLLRTIEVAFRNSTSIDHRVKAYDCWIEWINLCSLNMSSMCSPKQLRLLITPMRAKFSRMPVIVQKRCETFVYLLQKLEDKATLCLKEFLNFCFGPFDENKQSEGKNVAGVFEMGTKILIASIGHNHLNEKCISVADMKFKNALINASNFPNFCEVLINSVVECCVLLNEWETGSRATEKTIMQCLWRSLRDLIEKSNTETQHTCFTQLENTLKDLEKRIANDNFCVEVLRNAIEVMIEPPVYEKLKENILSCSLYLLNRNSEENSSGDKLVEFILECVKSETYAKVVCDYFQLNVKFENSKQFCEIWIKNGYFDDFSGNVDLSYLIWPVKNCHDFENKEEVYDKWLKLYSNGCKTEKLKLIIIQEIDKLFQENPLLSSNIVPFLKLISEPNSKDNELVGKYIKLISSLSTLPNLDDNSKQTLSTIILSFFDQTLPIFADIQNNESIKKLCESLENIVNVHKDYKILSKLTKKLSESPSKSLSKFSKVVMPILENLMLNDDSNVLNDSRKLIELFESKENEPEAKPASSSRAMRMLNIILANPSTPTNSMKFFGKHAETSTPLSAKSGNSQKTTPLNSIKKLTGESSGRKRKFAAALGNDESNSSDYVKISTEVKFEPSKLSEHQKEVYRKRREDIPALYEDLSQSQMSNMSDSNSKTAKDGLEKIESEKGEEEEAKKTESSTKSDKDTSETDKTKGLRKSTRQTFKQIKFTTDEFFVTPLKRQKLSEESGKKAEQKSESVEKSSDDEKKPKHVVEKLLREKRKSLFSKKMDDYLVDGLKSESPRRKSTGLKQAEEKSSEESEKSSEDSKPEEKAQREKRKYVKKVDHSVENQTQDSKTENVARKSLNSKQTESNQVAKSDESEKSKVSEEVTPREKRKYVKKKYLVAENQAQDSKTENSRRKSVSSKQTESNQLPKSDETEKSKSSEEKEEEKAQREKRKSSIKKVEDSVEAQDSKTENSRRKSLISKQTESNQLSKSDESEKTKPSEETKPEEKAQREKRKYIKKVDDSTAENQTETPRRKSVSSKQAEHTQSSKSDKAIEETKPENTKKPEDEAQREKRKYIKKVDDSTAENQTETPRRKSFSSKQAEPTPSSKSDKAIEETKPINTKKPEEEDKKSVFEPESAKKPNVARRSSVKQTEISPETPDIIESSETQTASRRRSLFKQVEAPQENIPEKKESPPVTQSKIAITLSTEELQKTLMEDLSFSLSENADKHSAENKKQDLPEVKSLIKKRKGKEFRGAQTLRARKSKKESFQHVTADTSPSFLSDSSVIVLNDSTVIELDSIVEPKEKTISLFESEDIIESSQTPEPKCKAFTITSKSEEKSPSKLKLPGSSDFSQESLSSSSSTSDEQDRIIPQMKTLSVKLSQLTSLDLNKQPVEEEHTSPTQDKMIPPRRSPRSSPRLKKSPCDQSPPLTDTESVVFIPSEQLPDTETCEIIPSVSVTEDVPEMTLRSECLTPILQQKSISGDLPTSPVTFDTPDRTVELLNNTSDISPITQQELQRIADNTTPMNVMKQKRGSELKPYLRVARLLQMANPGVSMGSPSGANWKELQCSPSRTKRMKMKRGEDLQVLTFSREIPSPLVVPASGILKRKICGDESVLPCPKRKRVNFSDPAITEKKVFIKDSEEYSESPEIVENGGDYEDTPEPTEKVIQLDDLDKLLESELEREEMFPIIKALCELKFKSLNIDNAKFISIFKTISEDNGIVPEIVDSISNYLAKKDESEECRQLFLNNLYLTLEDLATEKIEAFIKRLVEVFNIEKEAKVSNNVENIFDDESIMSKVKDYVESLFDDDERNQFLVKLMQFASSNLPVQKQFLQNHLDLVQGFVVKMD